MDDYFALTRIYREFIGFSAGPLKDFGCMACMHFIENSLFPGIERPRLLEMGHGFSPKVMERFQERAEVWGVDDNQGLHYFQDIDWEQYYKDSIVDKCQKVKLVRGLVGSTEHPADLPEEYFDGVYSISILEEVSEQVLADTVRAAAKLLKPGGWLFGTHDLNGSMLPGRIERYLQAHREAGLEVDNVPDLPGLRVNWEFALVENPATVMHYYLQVVPEDRRRYLGHWATLFTASRKLDTRVRTHRIPVN